MIFSEFMIKRLLNFILMTRFLKGYILAPL